MTKTIFTKRQAVSVLVQLEKRVKEINIFAEVEATHKYFNKSCEELEKQLLRHLDARGVAAVVDEVF